MNVKRLIEFYENLKPFEKEQLPEPHKLVTLENNTLTLHTQAFIEDHYWLTELIGEKIFVFIDKNDIFS